MRLATNNIIATTATQVRKKLDGKIIEAYSQDIQNGAVMPPVVVFAEEGSESYFLADGFHRLHAAVEAGCEQIEVELHIGKKVDALMYALGANAQHGLRRTNADKHKAVVMALENPEISLFTQQEIADICRVTTRTVRRIQTDLLLKETAKNANNRTMSGSKESTMEDFRASRTPPTQEMVDRAELRTAMSLIKGLPYDGDQVDKLGLSQDDIADLNYCLDWLTKALEAYVAVQYEANVHQESENRVVAEK